MKNKDDKPPHGDWVPSYRLKNGAIPCDLRSLPRCTATAKSTKKRCGQIAVKGKKVCWLHGGRSKGGGHTEIRLR